MSESTPLHTAATWLEEGRPTALATVVSTWGSSPRRNGAHLVADDRGRFEGSVSGGCIEGSVITAAEAVLKSGKPQLLHHGVSQERAWEMGLSCGGKISVYVQPLREDEVWQALQQALLESREVALVMHLSDGGLTLLDQTGTQIGRQLVDPQPALEALKADRAMFLDSEDQIFVRPYRPAPRLVVVGGVHIAQSLLPMAETAGFGTVLIDPRTAFANPNRFPQTDIRNLWPDEAFASLDLNVGTAVVTLTHDPKLDDPALTAALRSPAYYIGALGSKRTQEKRLARLGKIFSASDLARIHGPVGLNLGGRDPRHIAVAVLAEMIATRFK